MFTSYNKKFHSPRVALFQALLSLGVSNQTSFSGRLDCELPWKAHNWRKWVSKFSRFELLDKAKIKKKKHKNNSPFPLQKIYIHVFLSTYQSYLENCKIVFITNSLTNKQTNTKQQQKIPKQKTLSIEHFLFCCCFLTFAEMNFIIYQ